jgi:MFS family permease
MLAAIYTAGLCGGGEAPVKLFPAVGSLTCSGAMISGSAGPEEDVILGSTLEAPDAETAQTPGQVEPLMYSSVSHAWRALRHRNFRLFFGGQSISLVGSWMTLVATRWLVYRLTGSALLLGTVGFVGQIPSFLLAPFAGVWMDRLDRRKVLLWTQSLSMIQSLLLAAMTLSGRITIPWLMFLCAAQGIVNAFDMPGRQAFVVEMLEDRRDLSNAIAINSSMVNATRLIGPALAGILIAATNEGWCFLIDGCSFIAVIASLSLMRLRVSTVMRIPTSTLKELKVGWTYVSESTPIRTILLLFALISLMGMPFVVLMPIFAVQVLHGGPNTLGFLMGALGVGALASALSLAARKSVVGLIRMIPLAAGVFGLGLIGFGLSHTFWFSLMMALVAGMGMMQGMASSNTIIQTIVSEDKRGRVMSYYAMALVGMAPFGSLFAGTMAHSIGAPRTVMISGVVILLGGAWFAVQLPAVNSAIGPIYRKMGILPDGV